MDILSKQTDALGVDQYRDNLAGVPMAYRPTISHSAALNPKGTSVSVQVRSTYPIVNEVNGVKTSTDQFLMQTKFTALQHVTNDTERAAIFDKHIEFLQAARASILEGRLPVAPVDLA